MSGSGHFRPTRQVLPAESCPLRPESDRIAAVPRNDAMGRKQTNALQQKCRGNLRLSLVEYVSPVAQALYCNRRTKAGQRELIISATIRRGHERPENIACKPSRHANPNHSDWHHYRLALRETGALASRLYHQRSSRRSGLVHRIPSSSIGGSIELCCDYTFNRCCGRSHYHPLGLEELSSPWKTQMNRRCT